MYMSIQRSEYLRDLIEDAKTVTSEPSIVAAIVLSDSINGLRTAMLEHSDNVRNLGIQHGRIADAVNRNPM
jgi:hypothetical protein